MAINALNCGANVWLADLEDANTPHWRNVVGGQVVLRDAVRRTLAFTAPDGKRVPAARGRRAADDRAPPARLAPARAAPAGRRRAGGRRPGRRRALPVPQRRRAARRAAAGRTSTCPRWRATSRRGCGGWCSTTPSRCSGLPAGSIRATMLIETIPAAFEMEEMLHALGSHAAGLNAGRWDYLFSVIKVFRDAGAGVRAARPRRGDHDRADDARLHRPAGRRLPPPRRAWRSAAWPRSSRAGATPRPTSGRWPRSARTRRARPATASTAPGWPTPTWCRSAGRSSTACSATGPTSSTGSGPRSSVTAEQLLDVAGVPGERTMAGLRANVEVALRYLAAWLGGNGAVGIHNLMEDAATAEISRSQVWQWMRRRRRAGHRRDGHRASWCAGSIAEEVAGIGDAGPARRRPPAVRAGGAGRRVPRLPHPAGLRADRLMTLRRTTSTPSSTAGWRRSTPPGGRLSRASGPGGSRCTPATCRPTPSSRGWRPRWGTAALAALDEHGLPDLGLDPALVEQVLPRVRAKLAARAGRGPAGRRRGRLPRRRPTREDDDVPRRRRRAGADLARGPRRRRSASGPSRWRGRPGAAASAPSTSSSVASRHGKRARRCARSSRCRR